MLSMLLLTIALEHPCFVIYRILQLFDEGRLTDGQGRTVQCKDAVFVMTSNLASDEIAEHALELRRDAEQDGHGEVDIEVSKEFKDHYIRPILKRHFQRDEFLGRIDEMLYFLPFSAQELRLLTTRQLSRWASQALKRHNITLEWTEDVVDYIIADYDVHYGARSIQHAVDNRIINKLAEAHEFGRVKENSHVSLSVKDNQVVTEVKEPLRSKSGWFA
eukprot:m.415376 g.415376  ORF g.415376 m.415376 type:complete len:218 (-) comp56597_c0_seq30:1555-2208(-)